MAAVEDICAIFDNLSSKFNCLVFGRNEKQKQIVTSLLDQLNCLNYNLPFATNNKSVLLIHQLCSIVAPSDELLVKKCCKLILNLITLQHVVIDGRILVFTVQWLINYLKLTEDPDEAVIKCLKILIRDNVEKIQELLPNLIGTHGVLTKLAQSNLQEVQFRAVKCLECVCYVNDDQTITLDELNVDYLDITYEIFLKILAKEKVIHIDEDIYCKLITSCLRGVDSVISQLTELGSDMGSLLGIAKFYMTYKLFDTNLLKPEKILPSNLGIADVTIVIKREKRGGKIIKQRKQRKSAHRKDNIKQIESTEVGCVPNAILVDNTNIITSDSDYSDSEMGKSNKTTASQSRVRQAALELLLTIIKLTKKDVLFNYWSSLFPDGSPTGVHTLNLCLLNEPSSRGRIAVLNAISAILNGSKVFMAQAETSEKNIPFTPFSMVLGSMIKELHECLCVALKDNSIPVLTQTLKCLSLLVQATPYHRIFPGLITNIIKHVRPFIRHRDATVQVSALIVLGCILASEPIVSETMTHLAQYKYIHLSNPNKTDSEIEYAEFSSEEDESQTTENNKHLPWLLEKCLRNLGVIQNINKTNDANIVPAPVKLESLQLLSAMSRNYYHSLLAPYIVQVGKAIEISLMDKYMDLRLHAGRAADSIGHAMQQYITQTDEPKALSIDRGIAFWQLLVSGPLTALLQDEHVLLRSIACDCLGSIGPEIFEHLPKDKQILIITRLLACSRDEDNNVKGAAVRALAISVLYPSLREDLGFAMDTAEAILRTLENPNLTLRIKSSWALGNLSDALVAYRNTPMNETLPDSLIIKLLNASIKMTIDNNKIKSNTARALGNLLRLVTLDMLKKPECKVMTETAIRILVDNSTKCSDMKVRWNSCYAIGNFMKNSDLFIGSKVWQANVYSSLIDLVINFRNFKVRINAALALSVPEDRKHYGKYYFKIWEGLLKALDNTQHFESYIEYQHRDNLIDQICLSVSHLTTFLTSEDLNRLNRILVCHIDALGTHLYHMQERLVPEKFQILYRAAAHVQTLPLASESDEHQIVVLLKNLFDCV